MTSCADARDLQRYLDGDMGEVEREALERHIEECTRCESRLEALSCRTSPDWPRPPRVPPPPSIPGFDIQAELGVGGMGIVYLAYQVRMKRPVALKVILSWARVTPQKRQLLMDEAVTAGRVGHANVVQVIDADEHQGVPYLVMEYCSGGSLAKQLDGTPMSVRTAAELVKTLARAVQAVHAKDIIHCDLKPANVLIAEDRTVKISDFGLARSFAGPGGAPPGPVGGSPPYMAPEQLPGATRSVGVWTDVYALGAILYECLTGRPPFKGPTKENTCEMVRSAEPVPPRQLQPHVPRGLEEICLKCLHKEPTRRYSTAEVLAGELRCFLEGKPLLHTRRVGPGERLWRSCRRNLALSVACALAVLALIVGTTVSILFGLSKSQTASQLAVALDDSEKKSRMLEVASLKATDLALGLGLHLCEQGDVPLGLLWLAHSLETAPPEAADLERAIRTNLAAWGDTIHPLRASLPGPREVLVVAYSPDGRFVATGTADGVVQLWDAATGQPSGPPIHHHKKKVTGVAFSPDSRTLLTGSWDKTATLCDVATRRAIILPHRDEVWAAAFSRNGKTVLTGSGKPAYTEGAPRGEARLWDATTGGELSVLPHEDVVYAVAFSRDGTTVITGSADKTARLWEVSSGCRLRTLTHDGAVWTVGFNREGTKVLTGSWDKCARLWDVGSDRAIWCHKHSGLVWVVAFSPDGTAFLTGDTSQTAQLWKTDGSPLGPPLRHDGPVLAATFSPDSRTVLTGCGDRTARLWDATTGKRLGPALLTPGQVLAVAFSPDGKTALTGSQQDEPTQTGQAMLWDLNPNYAGFLLRPPCEVSALALNKDGNLALVGGEGGIAWLCRTDTGEPVGEPFRTGGDVSAATFAPDGETVLIATRDWTARQWRVASRQPFGPEFRGTGIIMTLTYSPDGRTVLTGSGGEVRQWDVATGEPVGKPLPHESSVWAAAFGPSGRTILTGCLNGTARHWDLTTGQPAGPTLREDKTGSAPNRTRLRAVALSTDGRTALTGCEDGCVRFWDVATGRPIGPPLLHPTRVFVVAFGPDGRSALTGVKNEVRRWRVPAPLRGDVARVVLWTQVITGTELDHGGAVCGLDSHTWQERRRRLAELGRLPEP